ncbi:hypothetical protein QAD02_001412 [Eretmocerus hayati]|uniref:Uncharacterized protein n=1 Tax=Eretmocerus hayati TaxID=131215 RepID=A0ACC2NGX7_9HYME|nr:hypothetical protein QAD02_001412 [Eretmocerus hayati]
MDTRAPPICPRQQDNRCQQSNKSKQQEVTLPPLDPFPTSQRQRNKQSGWRSSSAAPPGLLRQQEIQRRRPYRVLALGATPLMHACQQGDRHRVLKLLREQEETVGYRDRALRSALHYCMDAGTGGALAQAAPELVDSPDADGHTALHLAVIGGDSQLVAVLLANGANVNALDLQGHSVLHWAVVCGEVECVRLVLAAGARPSIADHRGGTALHYAAQCCGAPASSELAVPKKSGLAVLHALLEYGADVHARDEDGRQPVLWAASAGSPDAILALVRVGGSAVAGSSDKDGLTALHCAASRGHARCIETLVNLCDAQPDHVDDNGCSALHYAATLGHADATSLLLRLGADPNRQDRKGRTPALCAAAKGQLETLKILAQHGGSLHARTIRGTGLAHEAVASGRLELVRWLARRRPGLLDVATPDGRTPLHVAALHGYLDVCKLLLDSGARVNSLLRTSKGTLMTALDTALYRGHRDAAKLIQMHGGLTAQHIAARKPGHNRVFASKLRAKPSETSSDDSEKRPTALTDHNHHNGKSINNNEKITTRASNAARRQHQDSRDPGSTDVYYEERWVERRTRRRAKARRLSRHDSRSFSEEELRRGTEITSEKPIRSTVTKQDHQQKEQHPEHKRALSEGAGRRLDDGDATGSRGRKEDEGNSEGKMGEASESRSEAASTRSDDEYNEDAEDAEEDSSVSDDSLEIVVVRRSLEKTSERIVSGRSRTRTHLETSSSKDTNKGSSRRIRKNSKRERKSAKQQETKNESKDIGDNTSQEQEVEKVTVTADVHEHHKSKESPRETDIPEPPTSRSKIDEMLEKADEMQSALMSQAADLRKDMEQLRLQEANVANASGTDGSTEDTNRSTDVSVSNSARDETPSRTENTENKQNQVIQGDEAKQVKEKSEVEALEKDDAGSRRNSNQETIQKQQTEIDGSGGVVGVRLRRDSNGRDSGIEPSPRVYQSRIPRRSARCCPNSERQQALNMDTVTRDLQISMRRYHLERKIFFQLMELKRLQIRHGRSNENVLIKRQVDTFHKAGMSGPALGVARYDQPFTFRHFEAFLYDQLRRLQRRSATPDWCTEAKQCTQKTHRCHHATSAYTSVPIYTYLGGGGQERSNCLPNIEARGKGQMTVKLTRGQEKQIIALPTEKLDKTKRYYVTFTVRGDTTDSDKPKTPSDSPTKRLPKNS